MIRFYHHRLLNLAVFCVLSACGAFGQSIQGRITDNTGAGIAGVPVMVLNTEIATTTDSMGAYRVPLAPGSYMLRFGFDRFDVGNVSVALTDEIPVTVDVNLSEEHSRLSRMTVGGSGEKPEEAHSQLPDSVGPVAPVQARIKPDF